MTRGLLIAVALLSFLVVALFGALLRHEEPRQRAARTPEKSAARPASSPERRRASPSPAPATTATTALARTAVRTPDSRRPRPPGPEKTVVARTPSEIPGPALPLPPLARVSIVIDDLGQSIAHLEQLSALQLPLSIAVIPGLPASARTVREASRRGIELLLHQPMEPHENTGKNPGESVLLTSMPPEAVRGQVRAGLAAVPGAVGVNNHMGSRFTEDAAGVGALMAELKEHRLFWLDSRTSPASRGVEAARAAGVPAVARDVFIDAEVDADFIRGQLRKLVETARARGSAVGIGHPHPETIAALRELRDELLASGVQLVPVSRLVRSAPARTPVPAAPAIVARDGNPAPPGTRPADPTP